MPEQQEAEQHRIRPVSFFVIHLRGLPHSFPLLPVF